MKISDFSEGPNAEPETTPEPEATPDDLATLVAYGTELLAMAITEASDKIVAAILAAKMAELTQAKPTFSEAADAAVRDGLFQGYNTLMAKLQTFDEQGDPDGEEEQKQATE